MSYEEGLKRLNRKSEVKEAIARRLHEEQCDPAAAIRAEFKRREDS